MDVVQPCRSSAARRGELRVETRHEYRRPRSQSRNADTFTNAAWRRMAEDGQHLSARSAGWDAVAGGADGAIQRGEVGGTQGHRARC